MQSVFAMSADVSVVTQWTALVMSVPAMIEVAFAMAKLVAPTYPSPLGSYGNRSCAYVCSVCSIRDRRAVPGRWSVTLKIAETI
jgi:hypothetical protein